MLKLTVAMLGIALAGNASADGSGSLRIDASSNAAFKQSLVAFKEELSPEQRQAFADALKDIWAESERRKDYFRRIHGLSYEEVVNLTTGETAELRRQAAAAPARAAPARSSSAPGYRRSSPWEGVPPPPSTWQPRGGTDLTGPGPSPQ